MAQMRIKDQDLVLEQVKEQIDMQGLAVLNTCLLYTSPSPRDS